ncbi:drebrin-like b [Latimeria chalumnae]|uniref:Drebrin like n=1 Tax=Latimeria chalumnae TaxID=7897 RepID=H3BAR8_LATCH|nr:PREDICTED: drebrin-like protein [Latimeria chalumnae]|eukprot:XP_005995250.1 PREDICTED: drebrin-like protein [Latimeria chalumnae]
MDAVNLSKNGSALQAAYRDVLDGKTATDWALFTYEGNSNDIKLVETGDGGLEEMIDELNSGKVMYAFCRVKDPNSGLSKFVLINWTGEGVKDARKGVCANHVHTIANFLKGAHVTVNARADEDVEPDSIIQKVAKASGANYSFHKESKKFQDTGPQGPVGSVYQKTNAISEIKRVNKSNFWAEAEKDEEKRREAERQRADQDHQRLERERREREQREAEERERRFKERASEIDAQKNFQRQQETESRQKEKQLWEEQEKEHQAVMRKGIKRSGSVEKAHEAASVISQRSTNPRDIFKQKERSTSVDASSTAAQPGKLKSPFLQRQNSEPEPPPSPLRQPVRETAPASPVHSSLLEEVRAQQQPQDEEESKQEERTDDRNGGDGGDTTNVHRPQEEEDLYQAPEEPSDLYENPAEPTSLYEAPPDPSSVYEEPPVADPQQPVYEEYLEQDLAGKGICARALYDYQAADDTEITFDPDNIITNIEMIDEGWWRGYGPDGRFGMFPANYVELLNE